MQTIKTCELDNNKKHVCFQDLQDYWRKDEYLTGLSAAETAQIRKNLGLPTEMAVDSTLDEQSKNPVQNRVVTKQLQKKPDIDQISKVGITGQYGDLRNKPCGLPNPYSLVIVGLDANGEATEWRYDGSELTYVNLNTKLSNFENDKCFVDKDQLNQAITVKGIIVNGELLAADCDKFVKIDVPTRLSQLIQDMSYMTSLDAANRFADKSDVENLLSKEEANRTYVAKSAIDQTVSSTSSNAVSSAAVYNTTSQINNRVTATNSIIDTLNSTVTTLENQIRSLNTRYEDLKARLEIVERRLSAQNQ